MKRKGFSVEQIVAVLKQAEIATELGVNRSTVYRALKKAEAGATLTTGSDHG